MRIFLSGGGTGGSVSPLLAISQEIKKHNPEAKFLFIGTRQGLPERELAQSYNIPYQPIFSGKLSRYFCWRNFVSPFLIIAGFLQSVFLILKFKPKAIVSAGGFVAVPLVWAGWFFRTPIFIHQQDVIPGLANKLMAPFAKIITVSLEKSLNDFLKEKTVLTGNPVRPDIKNYSRERAIKRFDLETNLPTLLVIGGGTGAENINKLINKIIPELVKFCQIIHITGKRKIQVAQTLTHYHQYEFLNEAMPDALTIADLIISRAGMGFLTELSILGKPAIIIPMPNSHQEINAQYFAEQKAIVLMEEKNINHKILFDKIHQLIFAASERSVLSLNISKLAKPDAASKIAEIILKNI
ncbi:MAG: undecaprenyldiphospho-muramoylpentapeptide beta-N-acetylglucosaminyltransferase [Patescibacteria group bacterium]|nr:undecaprenyldiphospho-muramoylpentapeptide beta-N-acetylglucosaminyltransferase [Patescibacteria group bacterium]MDD5164623.1 undecaprenyldiphospho-muramoylpentapeptide beta-N-acetylglucosaminyltransferase [Patescibacteria group bacterium]MDD5534535.1 undecaprenyldiphospho-muramoylpentapeptide beta-N-acetylglucosaminyltransferase [Patescibacteria group bacterium]